MVVDFRLAIVVSHPIQYQIPLFRALSKVVDLHVFFAHRQSAQQQGDLSIRPGLLGQVIVNNQCVLSAVAIILAHGATGERCQVLHGCRV